jgi:alkylated DNA repair dioxygenase AlkB
MIKPIVLPGNGSICEFPGARLRYFESFFSKGETNKYFEQLKDEILWQQDSITVYGKTYSQPRLTALYANNSLPYSYSGITMHPHQITPILCEIQNRVQCMIDIEFTTVLLNLYRNGKDSNGWHADNEKELGENPAIASVSFGAERFFHLKHKSQKELRLKIPLRSGKLINIKDLESI